jgi:hypothetical protein
VKPEAIIVAPGDRTGPEVGETATDGEAEALTDEPGVAETLGAGGMAQPELAPARTEGFAPPQAATKADAPADPDAAGPAGLIETTKPARAIATIAAAATPRVARKRDLPVTRLLPNDEDILSRPFSVTSAPLSCRDAVKGIVTSHSEGPSESTLCLGSIS